MGPKGEDRLRFVGRYEMINLLEKEPENQKSFEEVEETIRASLRKQRQDLDRHQVLRQLKVAAKVEHLVRFNPPKSADPEQDSDTTADGP